MREYQKRLARLLAESRAFFFQDGLRLKDGRPSPYFVNLGVLNTGRLSRELGRCFAEWMVDEGLDSQVDVVVGPSYKGSAIAQSAAQALWEFHGRDVAFDYDRKEAKTYGEATGHGYLFVTGAAIKGGRVLVVDDVGTSMATKLDLVKKLGWLKPRVERPLEIMGVGLAVDREQTQAVYDNQGRLRENKRGKDALAAFREDTGLTVWSLLGIREMVEYLHRRQVEVLVNGAPRGLDDEIMQRFYDYLALYGREDARR
jgi:orotate phosphoribosyltransferase